MLYFLTFRVIKKKIKNLKNFIFPSLFIVSTGINILKYSFLKLVTEGNYR